MSDRYKCKCSFSLAPNFKFVTDAKNGIYKCENFAEQVEQNRFPEYELGSLGGIAGWCFKCTLIAKNDQAFLYPSIFGLQTKVQLRTFFNVFKKDGSSGSMRRKAMWNLNLYACHAFTDPFDVSELLNPDNKWLDDDGSLSIEYGFHINAVLDNNKIWNFNFHDITFNYTGEKNQMVRCTHEMILYTPLRFYCSAEISNFHCPQFGEKAEKIASNGLYRADFFRCLQILHGVRLQIDYCNFFDILRVANFFNFSNVIQYSDRFCSKQSIGYYQNFISFDEVIKFNLRHALTEKLRNLELKDVVEIAKNLDFDEATGEAMKIFVAEILYT